MVCWKDGGFKIEGSRFASTVSLSFAFVIGVEQKSLE